MPKSEGAYNRKFLNFHHFFDFVIEFPEPLADRLLGNAINFTELLLGKLRAMPQPEQLPVFSIQQRKDFSERVTQAVIQNVLSPIPIRIESHIQVTDRLRWQPLEENASSVD